MHKFRNFIAAGVFFAAPVLVVGPLLNRRITQENAASSRELLRAVHFAAYKHRNQRRKNVEEEPYILHPIRVSELVATLGGAGADVGLLQAAVLHDTVEDTETTFEELEQHFGPRVKGLVQEVSDDKSLPKDVRKRLQIEHAKDKSRDAKILSMADKVANLEDLLTRPKGQGVPVGWSVERIQQYCAWANEVASGLKGEAVMLDKRLQQLISGEFEYPDGKTYPALPPVRQQS